LALALGILLGARPAESLPLVVRGPEAPAFAAARWLRAQPDRDTVLELPVSTNVLDVTALETTTAAMVASTLHWRPLVNGYTGHPPPSSLLTMTLAQRLPDPAALATLRRITGIGWVIDHAAATPAPPPIAGSTPGSLLGSISLVHAQDVPAAHIYRVLGGTDDLVPRVRTVLADGDDGRTLLGLSRTTLDARAKRGRVAGPVLEAFGAEL